MKLLFLGDSLVAFYNWQTRFPQHTVINGGRAGETVAGLLADLPHVLHRCPAPERVFIMIGTNNLLREEYAFLPDYEKILNTLSDTLSPAHITVTSLPPFQVAHLAPSTFPRLNTMILQLCRQKKNVYFDLFAACTATPRTAAACFSDDGVHLSSLGYQIWSDGLARSL